MAYRDRVNACALKYNRLQRPRMWKYKTSACMVSIITDRSNASQAFFVRQKLREKSRQRKSLRQPATCRRRSASNKNHVVFFCKSVSAGGVPAELRCGELRCVVLQNSYVCMDTRHNASRERTMSVNFYPAVAQSWTWVHFAKSNPTHSTSWLTQSNPIHDDHVYSDPHPIQSIVPRSGENTVTVDLICAVNKLTYYKQKPQ